MVIGVTVSMGVASLNGMELRNIENNELIIQRADDALLQAKKYGRNRIELYRHGVALILAMFRQRR